MYKWLPLILRVGQYGMPVSQSDPSEMLYRPNKFFITFGNHIIVEIFDRKFIDWHDS
jgi:hypothetical protein